MKHYLALIGLFIAALFFTVSCATDKGGEGETEKTAEEETANAEKAETNDQDGEGKYKMKSGVVTYQTESPNMKNTSKLYFDDYGTKECREMLSVEYNGQKNETQTRMFHKDGAFYSLNMKQKTGMRDPDNAASQGGMTNMDIEKMLEMGKQDPNIEVTRETGEALGKTCDIVTIKDKAENSQTKTWIYKGIPLKVEMQMEGQQTTVLASNLEENADVPASMFEVPEGFTINDMGGKQKKNCAPAITNRRPKSKGRLFLFIFYGNAKSSGHKGF